MSVGVSGAPRTANADTVLGLTGVLKEVGDTFEPRTTLGLDLVFGFAILGTSSGSGGGILS